jgi:hypothetical protein
MSEVGLSIKGQLFLTYGFSGEKKSTGVLKASF